MSIYHCPRLARLLVSALVPDPDAEFLLGDLEEQFSSVLRTRGRFHAWRAYWAQVMQSAVPAARAARRRARFDRARAQNTGGSSPRRTPDMQNLIRDFRLGLRTAFRSPGYSLITILTLALAIGANTLLFSIANPLLIKPLPLEDQATIGWVWEQNGPAGVDRGAASVPDYREWRASTKTFSSLAGYEERNGTFVREGHDPESVFVVRVTPNLQDVWGLHAVVGRLFQPDENDPGKAQVAVLAYHTWNGPEFGADPTVVGRTYLLNGSPVSIVGVMEKEIELGTLGDIDMWTPLPLEASRTRDDRTLRVIGRLAPGATIAQADAEFRALSATQAHDNPATNENWDAHVVSTHQAITGGDTWLLLGLLGVVVLFVLLIACANLANLVLARVVARRQEFAVRQALGASRLQVIRPLLAEALILAAAGGLAGLGIAQAGLRAINAAAYDRLLQEIAIDGNVLIFTAVISLATPFLFALWPALGAGKADAVDNLRSARSTSGGPKVKRRSKLLVASQVALALSLLVVSALVIQTMLALRHVNIGIDVPHVIAAKVDLPRDRYPDDAVRAQFAGQASQRLAELPGVTEAAVASHLPVFDSEVIDTLSGTKHDVVDAGGKRAKPWASWFSVSPAFFRTVGISLLAGRPFAPGDVAGSGPVAIVSQQTAQRYFDGIADAVGQTITVHGQGANDRQVTIVGVVADTNNSAITASSPQIYVPIAQWPVSSMRLLVRSTAPDAESAPMRRAMRDLDSGIGISNPKTLRAEAMEGVADNRIINALFGGFAVLALVLAAAGLYGVISYSVGQRQREIGVRLALGAAPSSIRRMVLKDGLKVTAYGSIAGLALAFLLAHASASALVGISANDPKTFVGVLAVVVLVSLAALWVPALRAMRVDPAKSLRAE